MPTDATDRRILRAVQDKCTLTAEELGDLCGTSPSTALRRLRRLRDDGVIVEEVAVVNPKKVGRALQIIVGVRLDRDDAAVAAAFRRRMRDHPAVMQCYLVTGSYDYLIQASFRDMDEYDQFVEINLVANPHVAMTETNVVIKPVKVGLKIPIEEPPEK